MDEFKSCELKGIKPLQRYRSLHFQIYSLSFSFSPPNWRQWISTTKFTESYPILSHRRIGRVRATRVSGKQRIFEVEFFFFAFIIAIATIWVIFLKSVVERLFRTQWTPPRFAKSVDPILILWLSSVFVKVCIAVKNCDPKQLVEEGINFSW